MRMPYCCLSNGLSLPWAMLFVYASLAGEPSNTRWGSLSPTPIVPSTEQAL